MNLRKIKSIIEENLIYSYRENILLGPILLFILALVVYTFIGSKAFIDYVAITSYISIMSSFQYILLMLVIIYLGITSFDKDIKSKNIYISLQHLQRSEYFLGKVLSIIFLTIILNISNTILFYLGYFYNFQEIDYSLLYIFGFQQLEAIILVFLIGLITLLFNKNITRMIIFGLIFLLGHMLFGIKELIEGGFLTLHSTLESALLILYKILPNLEAFNVKGLILINNTLSGMFINSSIYLFSWLCILYIVSLFTLNKKDF